MRRWCSHFHPHLAQTEQPLKHQLQKYTIKDASVQANCWPTYYSTALHDSQVWMLRYLFFGLWALAISITPSGTFSMVCKRRVHTLPNWVVLHVLVKFDGYIQYQTEYSFLQAYQVFLLKSTISLLMHGFHMLWEVRFVHHPRWLRCRLCNGWEIH